MENECEALPGVARCCVPRSPGQRSTINTKTGYDDDDDEEPSKYCELVFLRHRVDK